MTLTLAVCSWSLRPTCPRDLADRVRACALDAVQLALDPIRRGEWDEADTIAALREAGIRVVSGMMATRGEDYTTLETIRLTGGVRPDDTWEENLAAAADNADLATRLGLPLVTLHIGFIPHDDQLPEWETLIDRLRRLVDVFASRAVRVAFETGQETAHTLLRALEAIARPEAGVNFDPANMLLYGMDDPVEALSRLAPRVLQIHIKDAARARTPGAWGRETPVGRGEVDWTRFFALVGRDLRHCNLVIEREDGEERVEDVRLAADLVRRHADWTHPHA